MTPAPDTELAAGTSLPPDTAATLDLGVIGNGSFGALLDARARVVWSCLPAFDGDPAFCALLSPRDHDAGDFAIELEDFDHSEQAYLNNTAVLRTVLHDRHGGAVEIVDFAPRWRAHGRLYRPVSIMRRVTPLAGNPRIRVRLRPLTHWGEHRAETTWGSNHVRYLLPDFTLRLTTDVPVRYVREETTFVLSHPVHLLLGADESLTRSLPGFMDEALDRTTEYWREWVRYLSIPLEWQAAVIRSAITLKLCQYEDSGAIIAAMTTSIPEAPHTPRNWDYRYCWLRDAAFVVRALNRLGATRSMEEFLRYIFNIATHDGSLQPLYGIDFAERLEEHEVEALQGYRGMGPVRRGNLAWIQKQHDVYGSVVLTSTQLFFDQRLADPGNRDDFARLEPLGEQAYAMHDVPDAGLWEFRGRTEVHTYTAAMCWAACDRLSKIAAHLGLDERTAYWRERADTIHARVTGEAWNEGLGHFTDTLGGHRLDASLLLLADIGFIAPTDPRFVATVEAIGRDLKRGDGLFRYIAPDDFGAPETSFTICTFWYIDALAAIGRKDEARAMFERILARRNPLGLLSEDLSFEDGEAWGNFPQTYSHVGLIVAAMRLSRSWEEAS
ncbi:glycoside hydrolase family 15 protein [Luteimonas abyssi]|uniref:glycoside hydrolase family 15 protein n=1 Tax=Luteimonas abyssi TaxID=1247514 RepID=UPI0009E7EF9D|nr:glycoside hydrolase family 15 protein [Luteimonas abyssi]